MLNQKLKEMIIANRDRSLAIIDRVTKLVTAINNNTIAPEDIESEVNDLVAIKMRHDVESTVLTYLGSETSDDWVKDLAQLREET